MKISMRSAFFLFFYFSVVELSVVPLQEHTKESAILSFMEQRYYGLWDCYILRENSVVQLASDFYMYTSHNFHNFILD